MQYIIIPEKVTMSPPVSVTPYVYASLLHYKLETTQNVDKLSYNMGMFDLWAVCWNLQ